MAQDLFKVPGQGDNRGLYNPDSQQKKGSDLVGDQKDKFGASPDKSLAEAERKVTGGTNEKDRDLSADGLKQAERGSLYNAAAKGEFERAPLWKRIKNINKRKKAAAALGAGGIVSIVIALLTVAPVFRIPALMSGILGKVGTEVQDVVEDRAQRQIITYLLWRAGATPSDYVITDSIMGSLYATFRTNRLEDKIYKQTGLKIINDNGRIILTHDGTDLRRQVKNYDDVMKLLESPDLTDLKKNELKKVMKTIVRTTVPAWRMHLSSKYANWLKIKYKIPSYATRKYDNTKTKEQNLQDFRQEQVQVVSNNNLNDMSEAFDCIFQNNCSHFSENGQPVNTRPNLEEPHTGSVNQVAKDFNQGATEATAIVAKTGESFTDVLLRRVLILVGGAAVGGAVASSIPFVGQIDLLAVTLNAMSNVINNDLAAKIPAIMTGNALGAMYGSWQGYGDSIKAGKMDLAFVEMLNKQASGSEKAVAYNYAFNGEAKGVPVETKVNDNVTNPLGEVVKVAFNVTYYTIFLPLKVWSLTVSPILAAVGDLGSAAVVKLLQVTGGMALFENTMAGLFGENWKQEVAKFAAETLMKVMGIVVDPLATGAKLFNQLYAGGDLAMNTYCRLNLGCQALSSLKEVDITNLTYTQPQFRDHKLDMAVLPIKERLFSIDEPNSLASRFFRSMPSSNDPGSLMGVTFSQITKLPGTFLAAFSGTSLAATNTPEEDAAIAGVRQYGFTVPDRNQEMASQVRQQANPVCPEVDQEKTSNICKADKEVAQSLMCYFPSAKCPELGGN